MPTAQTFVEQLRQARDATHSKNHPYFRMNGLYWYTLYGRTDDTPAEEG